MSRNCFCGAAEAIKCEETGGNGGWVQQRARIVVQLVAAVAL
jgi:hypothetical protein